jgi:hypothetical protein
MEYQFGEALAAVYLPKIPECPDGYLVRKTTIAMVKKAIVVIKMLCPQRAICPIMFNSN